MLSVSVLSLSTASSAQIGIGIGFNVRIAPPALPVYEQPICPGPGYLWTPGYWAWSDDDGYYWVPGTWVVAPIGMLWTPGYWGFAGGFYGWHAGYWGPHVGFYGGINYGFGYTGVGFFGGEWRGGAFFYNRAVVNVNVVNVRNVYSRTVVVNNRRVAFNGPGGIEARPTRLEEEYGRERHTEALSTQREHEHAARQNRALFASQNHGRPAIAATARPGEFSGRNVVKARAAGAAYHEPKMSPREARSSDFNRDSRAINRNESARNEPAKNAARRNDVRSNDRPMTRPENQPARNNQARSNDLRSNQERSNQATSQPSRNDQLRNNEARSQVGNSPRENTRPAVQEKQARERAPQPAKQARPEQKHGKGEGRR